MIPSDKSINNFIKDIDPDIVLIVGLIGQQEIINFHQRLIL